MVNKDLDIALKSSTGRRLSESVSTLGDSYKPYILGLIILCILHFLVAFFFTPSKVIQIAGNGASKLSVRAGYGFGMFITFAVPFPLLITFLSLISRSKRNLLSFSKTLFWAVLFSLFANGLYQIIFVPIVLY